MSTRLSGTPASPGVAVGPAVVLQAPTAHRQARQVADVPAERRRLREAAKAAARDLEALAARVRADRREAEAEIFHAQAVMAQDPALLDAAGERVGARAIDAATAVREAGEELAATLRALPDELLAARAADVVDVASRVAAVLDGVALEVRLERPAVVVAADLAPSVAASLPRGQLLGIVLEGGSPTAHAAILARAYGIPAVVGAAGAVAAFAGARVAALDGSRGEVVADPDPALLADLEARRATYAARVESARRHVHEPAVTTDGTRVALLANIGSVADVAAALEWGAEGVGLMRTEFLFLERPRAPDEDEQVGAYRDVLRAFAPRPVTVRLLDVGGDKDVPYLRLAPEANPMLGVRALRLARERRELFRTQLKALLRASDAGTLKVMAAMVADPEDVALLRSLWQEASSGLPAARGALGAMIEIPSAAVLAEQLFAELDFASLGTNDLLQYAVAADRGNAALARYHDPLHPALLRLVRTAADAARAAGKELSVCGEMAGDPASAAVLVGLGIRALSMTATSLPAVRALLRRVSLASLEALAREATALTTAGAVRARVVAALGLAGGPG